jgi:tetratricopeptide (TPR) repeat protein
MRADLARENDSVRWRRWIGGLVCGTLACGSIAPVSAADVLQGRLRALAWEACLAPTPPASWAGICAAAFEMEGWSASEMATLLGYQGRALLMAGEPGEGLRVLNQALAMDPDATMALLARGLFLVGRGDFTGGVRDLTAVLRLLPGDPDAMNARAVAYVRLGQLPQAIADLGAGLARFPDNPILLHNRANALRDSGAVEAALRDYDRLILVHGRSAPALTDRCLARLVRGDLRIAQADCEAAEAMAPKDPGIIENRGLVELRWNRPDNALAHFNLALSIREDLPWALYGRGIVRLRRGDAARAGVDIRAARALDPKVTEDLARFGIRP